MRGAALKGGVALALAVAQPAWAQPPPAQQPPAQWPPPRQPAAQAPAGPQQPGQQGPDREQPALIRADRLDYDRDNQLITATGNVEISQGRRILLADRVTFDERTEVVTATGNVTLLEPTGEVLFADYAELRNELKDGVVRNLRILFPDESRLAAAGARRRAGVESEMRKAVFSPCELCPEDPERPPLWQIKAIRVVHDEQARNIEYYDALLEFMGFPVAYTPYLSHPDPTVDRRSGFLAPRLGSRSQLGLIVGTPYYWNIAPDKDATIEPIITGQQGPVLNLEYRQRFTHGEFEFEGSGTRADRVTSNQITEEDQIRGHVFARGRYDLNETWRTGLDVERTSDDTYLTLYDFTSIDVLTSRAFIEGFHERSYAAVNSYAFQGLRAFDRSETTPLILPIMDYNYMSDPTRHGAYITLDANALQLLRSEGADSRRLSFKGGWHLPYRGDNGHVFGLTLQAQGDVYLVNDVPDPSTAGATTLDGTTGRFFPQMVLDWRYPLARDSGKWRQLIEPVAALVVGPNGGNPAEIPNEDSQAFEFDETDLFTGNRFTGLDRVEGGQRLDYGLNMGLYGPGSGSITAFLGQSFRFRKDSPFRTGSGLEDQLSDLVGRIDVSPGGNLNLLYRFRFNKDDFTARASEVGVNAGPEELSVALNYFFIDGTAGTSGFGDREEINISASSRFSEYWRARVSHLEDLTDNGGALASSFGLVYEDECFLFSATFRRTFTRDREVRPSDAILFRFNFKHLGEIKA